METVPPYVSIVFILTTFASIAFLLRASRRVGLHTIPTKILAFVLPLWISFQAALSWGGFYENFTALPPRLLLFGVLPAFLFLFAYLVFYRLSFIDRLPLRALTLLHVVRVPVEIVLFWLATAGQVPFMMTFEGRNFDIVSGLLAPIMFWVAFRGGKVNRGLLIAYNILGLILLANIVSIALLSLPSPLQQLNFDQPNRAVLYFPYIWLPTIVVPIVLFAHLASLWKLIRGRDSKP